MTVVRCSILQCTEWVPSTTIFDLGSERKEKERKEEERKEEVRQEVRENKNREQNKRKIERETERGREK